MLEQITNEKYLNLFKKDNWVYASRNSKEDIENGKPKPNAVVVIPVIKTGEYSARLVVTEEYREPIRGIELGFCAGLIDAGETIEEAARRELKEETGLEIESIDHVSLPVTSSAGMTDELVVLVLCTAKGEISNAGNQSDEDITTHLVTSHELKDMMDSDKYILSGKGYFVMACFAGLI